MKKYILSLIVFLGLAGSSVGQSTTITINKATGQVNAPTDGGAVPNFTSLKVGSVTLAPGDYATLTGTQTLTNKTLTAAVLSNTTTASGTNPGFYVSNGSQSGAFAMNSSANAWADDTSAGSMIFRAYNAEPMHFVTPYGRVVYGNGVSINMGMWYGTDNTWDFGQSGNYRPRTVYAATSVISPLGTFDSASVGSVSNTEIGYLDGVTSSIQTQLTIASQAEAEAGSENTKKMTPLRTAQAIAALASGGAVTEPKTYFVRSNGNNGTAVVGDPTKPWLTAQAAYNTAETAAVPYILDLGSGSYSFTVLSYTWSNNLTQIKGSGMRHAPDTATTQLAITATGSPGSGSDGGMGPTIDLEVFNLSLYLNASGGDCANETMDTYMGGNGGQVTLRGHAYVSVSSNGGNGSGGGTANGGNGGVLYLYGMNVASGGGFAFEGGTGSAGGSAGAPGQIYADGCNFMGGSITNGAIYQFGRTSYPTAWGITLTADYGGNAPQ